MEMSEEMPTKKLVVLIALIIILGMILIVFIFVSLPYHTARSETSIIVLDAKNTILTKENNNATVYIYLENPTNRMLYVDYIIIDKKTYMDGNTLIENVSFQYDKIYAEYLNHTWNGEVPTHEKTLITEIGFIVPELSETPFEQFIDFTIITTGGRESKDSINLQYIPE